MSEYDYLNAGYISKTTGVSRQGEAYEQTQVELVFKDQDTADKVAAKIANLQPVYINARKIDNPKPFEPDQYGRTKTTVAFLGFSKKQHEKL